MKSISEVMDSYDMEVLMNEEIQFKIAEQKEKQFEENLKEFIKEIREFSEDYLKLINEVYELSKDYDLDLDFDEVENIFIEQMM